MTAPVVHGPAQLPDLRTWLMSKWTDAGPFAAGARARASMHPLRHQDWRAHVSWERDTLRRADLWWVSADMVDLLLAVAAGIPDDATHDDAPPLSPAGLVVFEKPWQGIDTDDPDNVVTVDAMLWGGSNLPPIPERGDQPLGEGVVCASFSSYRRLNADNGLSPTELSLAVANGLLDISNFEVLQLSTGPPYTPPMPVPEWKAHIDDGTIEIPGDPNERVQVMGRLFGDIWVPIGRSDWPMADRIDREPWPMTDNARASFVEDRKVMAALWTLVRQEGVTSRTVHRERAAQRRATRAGVTSDSAVQIVTLRRPRVVHPDGGELDGTHGRREHDHRWYVTGHWRWQACGVGRAERRLTFVSPHIKGPEDKPLRTKERVNAWVR
jgi:hypothetical protein